MRKPRFTDTARYPRGYTNSKATDIRATFRAARARLKQAEPTNVQELPLPSRERAGVRGR